MSKRIIWRTLCWIVALLVILPVLGSAAGYWWWSRSLPQLDGEIKLAGLGAPVRIMRDAHGVPHIFAENHTDAARALGYIHAQDRMFQMDISRRVTQGRLSEIIGKDGLDYDRLFRTLDLAGSAMRSLAALSPEVQNYLQAYADGVNSWLAQSRQSLPLEYALLDFEPEPWRPEDSLLWGKAMAWKLSANWRQDALRAQLAAQYGKDRTERLFPKPSPEWPVTLKPLAQKSASYFWREGAVFHDDVNANAVAFDQLLDLPDIGSGASNEWVIDGTRSSTGKPLLANDPHLELGTPILWYLARISTPEMTISGATVPGTPIVLLGQNDHVAWGFTTTESDTQDLFIETPEPGRPGYYRTPEGSEPIRSQSISIKVKGAGPVEFMRRSTRHGPIISEIDADLRSLTGGALVSLSWTGLSDEDRSAEAFFHMNRARNAQEFREALQFYQSPAQNIVFADKDGEIGFINAGAVPIRKSGDGRYPVDGASGDYDWTGTIPFEAWPKLSNPPAGAIVNANNTVAGEDYGHWLGYDQGPGFRALRIEELLAAQPKHDLDSLSAIQMDIQAVHARALVPYLLTLQPVTALQRQALDLLGKWDFSARHNLPQPLILDWWLTRMNQHLFMNNLDALSPVVGGLNAAVIIDILRHPDGFCREERAGSDCMKAVKAAFDDTLSELSQRHGDDPSRWRWGDEHVTPMENKVFDRVPGFTFLFGQSFASDGGFYSVNRGGNVGEEDKDYPLQRNSGAGFRGLYDLADPAKSRFIIATGQSGHPLSPFYADQLPLWREGKGISLRRSEAELQAEAAGILKMSP